MRQLIAREERHIRRERQEWYSTIAEEKDNEVGAGVNAAAAASTLLRA